MTNTKYQVALTDGLSAESLIPLVGCYTDNEGSSDYHIKTSFTDRALGLQYYRHNDGTHERIIRQPCLWTTTRHPPLRARGDMLAMGIVDAYTRRYGRSQRVLCDRFEGLIPRLWHRLCRMKVFISLGMVMILNMPFKGRRCDAIEADFCFINSSATHEQCVQYVPEPARTVVVLNSFLRLVIVFSICFQSWLNTTAETVVAQSAVDTRRA